LDNLALDTSSTLPANCNTLEFLQQWRQFEIENQFFSEVDDNLLNVSFLSLLNFPDKVSTQIQASQIAPQTNSPALFHTLPKDRNAISEPTLNTGNNQQKIILNPNCKEGVINKKKHQMRPSANGKKSLRKWRQWIWMNDQKNELIEVRDIYKKKKKPYDEWCSVLTTTKK
jgi:hypothetical protein